MKILAIRGEALASLSERFEVALDAPPLRDAGVFAIVGPTGSGKSTLLDALCLALFDRTPRLPGRGVRIGPEDDERERIASGDPRNMLRKGAGRGWAEVDFRGIDGRTWRARWEVRRARQRGDGRLQDAAMTLVDVESGRAEGGHRKGEVLAAIEARLGLSFAQFQRAVLLAQGRFAAFLDADDRERAELLERMTGTEIYGRISIEVARRAREEKLALERLDDQLMVLALLAPEERAAHERDVPTRKIEVARAAERVSALDAQLRWLSELDVIVREQAEVERELHELDAQLVLADAKRREIEETRAAEPVRAPMEARDAASATLALRHAAHQRLTSELTSAERARDVAQHGATESIEREASATRSRAELEPVLREARALDRELAIADERARAREQAAAEAAMVSRSRAEERAQHTARVAALEATLREARARRAAQGVIDAIGDDDAPRVLERLERLVEISRALGDTQRAHAAARDALSPLEDTARSARLEIDRHTAAVTDAEQCAIELRGALAQSLSGEVLRDALEWFAGTRDALVATLQAARGGRMARERASMHLVALDRARESASAARARQDDAARAGQRARDVLVEAERARDLARAMLDLAHLRAELRDGEACPLCGALEHPAVHEGAKGILPAQESRVSELRAILSEHERAAARAEAEGIAQHRAAEHARREHEAASLEAEADEARASAAASALAIRRDAWWSVASPALRALIAPWSSSIGASEADLETQLAALEGGRAHLLTALSAREAEERSLDAASVERERARATLTAAERAAREREAEVERGRAQVGELARELARLDADREELLGKLEPWREILEATVGALASLDPLGATRIATALERCVRARRDELAALAALATSEAALESLRLAHDRAKELEERALAARDESRATLAALHARRVALLDGDVDRAEAQAREHVERAERARSHAALALAAAESSAVAAARAHGESARALEHAERTFVDARIRLADALRAAAIDEETARRGLARGPEEIGAWRRELEQLDANRTNHRVVLAERARRRAAHEAEPPEGLLPRDALEPERARARASETAAHKLLASLEERLARDDRMRAERGAVEAAIASQRERVRTWSELEPLIGSNDGKRFRVFAQGLTLELLLDHANVQLERLAPRYALRRAPGAELAVQVVDREMGEEIRGIKSLSGGETFLVSLALALALASVTARRVPVHSLFIDEGFGGLDAESLEIALAALDALQATGRQVGVVSHVAALSERFAARVEVRPRGHAESTVEVVSA